MGCWTMTVSQANSRSSKNLSLSYQFVWFLGFCLNFKYCKMCRVKQKLHELMQQDRDLTEEDIEKVNPCNSISISQALKFIKNPYKCCQILLELIHKLVLLIQAKRDDSKTKDATLYHGESYELMSRRWGKLEKDFKTKGSFDISKIPDIYDCIKYDIQHNSHAIGFDQAEELFSYAKYLADIVIPQVRLKLATLHLNCVISHYYELFFPGVWTYAAR